MPMRGARQALSKPAILICPWERRVPTKTQQYDDTILLDTPGFDWVFSILLRHLGSRPLEGDADVWTFTVEQLRSVFHAAVTALGLLEGTCLYQLRHGGASYDLLEVHRAWEAVRSRGRWMSDVTVKRCAKSGVIHSVPVTGASETTLYESGKVVFGCFRLCLCCFRAVFDRPTEFDRPTDRP